MAGRRREKEAAGRLRKPVSGAVAGGVGSVGGIPGKNPGGSFGFGRAGRGLLPPDALEGQETPREVPAGREATGGGFGTYRVGGPNPRRGSLMESLPWARAAKGRPAG